MKRIAVLFGLACLFVLLQNTALLSQLRAEGSRPNILFAIADDWSQVHAGAYGCRWVNTPAFDRIAREGVLFNNCFTSNPKCSPCRASILTGRNTWQLKEACNHFGVFSAEYAVYPDLLEEAGYFVGFTGKGWGPGDFKAGGFKRNPAGPGFQQHKLKPPHRGITNKDYAGNFAEFLSQRPKDKPFCFWYGAHEPHRGYDDGAGIRSGKRTDSVEVPTYYPDNKLIRSDLLDYSLEVEWFDRHLGRMIAKLEEIGELDNTLILVTSDHGMPFPRVKGQIYEHGFHLPLAVRWGKKIKSGRKIDDFINVRDFAPTFMEIAQAKVHSQMTGKSFVDLLKSNQSGWITKTRIRMLVGKERHDLGRPHDWGYPVRALRTPKYLYVHNYEPLRWPVGNPETGYNNCDEGPTKTFLLRRFNNFYRLSFGMRPEEELYRVDQDADCVKNLAANPQYAALKKQLRNEMEDLLRSDGDPRALGKNDFFDRYHYVGRRDRSYDAWQQNHSPAPATTNP